MNTSKNRVNGIPAGFDIEKYEPCIKFDAVDWAIHFTDRYLIQHAYSLGEYFYGETRASMERRLAEPILPRRVISDGEGLMNNVSAKQVKDQSAFGYFAGSMCLTDDRYEEYSEMFRLASLDTPDADGVVALRDLMDLPAWRMHQNSGVSFEGQVTVDVDLHSSDEKLVSDFRLWLKETREKVGIRGTPRKFGETDFSHWARMRVLAYFDIAMWAKANSVKITYQALGNALFPNEYDIGLGERVRKVLIPLAEFAVAVSTVEALQSQVMADRSTN